MPVKCVLLPSEEQVKNVFNNALDYDNVELEYEVPADFSSNRQKYIMDMTEKFYGVVPIICVEPIMDVATFGKGFDGKKFKFEVTWIVRNDNEYPLAVVGTAYTPGFPKLPFLSLISLEYSLLMGFKPECIAQCIRAGCDDTSKCDIDYNSLNKEAYVQLILKALNEMQVEMAQVSSTSQALQTLPEQANQNQGATMQIREETAQSAQAVNVVNQPQQTVQQAQPSAQQPQQQVVQQPQEIRKFVEVLPGVLVEEQYTKYFNIDFLRYHLNKLAVSDPKKYALIRMTLPTLMEIYTRYVDEDEALKNVPNAMKVYIATQSLLKHILELRA
jgi:hypothetical protein